MNLKTAQKLIEAAIKRSDEMGVRMNIAVVDKGANLVAFARMDDAWLGSVDISIKKAKTAMFFKMETKTLTPLTQPGGSLYGIEHSNGGLICFPGGVPVIDEIDGFIGAIGISGSTVDNDHDVATFASKIV